MEWRLRLIIIIIITTTTTTTISIEPYGRNSKRWWQSKLRGQNETKQSTFTHQHGHNRQPICRRLVYAPLLAHYNNSPAALESRRTSGAAGRYVT